MYLAAERYSSPEADIVPSDGPGVPSNASLMAIEKITNIKGVGNFEGTKVESGGASELLKSLVRACRSSGQGTLTIPQLQTSMPS
jgi:hypothetical protein